MPPEVLEDVALASLNSFGVPARARRLVRLADAADVPQALREAGPDALVLGGGSNLLLAHDPDTVLQVALRGRHVLGEHAGRVLVEAAAGEPWDAFVRWTLAQHASGLENLALIPGLVGASPIQNVGAYGVETGEYLESLEAVHRDSGERRRFDARECAFGYRDSVFKHGEGRRWLIVSVRFALRREPSLRLDYGELRAELAARGVRSATPIDVAEAVSAIRRRKLPDPAVLGNAGSFFKNPRVTAAEAAALRARWPDMPQWPAGPGEVKLAAGWLIERAGFKGLREGDAAVDAGHALVLVNHGAATGEQILALARHVQAGVCERFGIALEIEPVVV